jgi:hypothetical protein
VASAIKHIATPNIYKESVCDGLLQTLKRPRSRKEEEEEEKEKEKEEEEGGGGGVD